MTSVCVYVWGVLTCFNQSDVVILSLCLAFSLSLSLSLSEGVHTHARMYVCMFIPGIKQSDARPPLLSLCRFRTRARALSLLAHTLCVRLCCVCMCACFYLALSTVM